MKKQRKQKRLVLNSEQIRTLTPEELENAGGGVAVTIPGGEDGCHWAF